MGHVLTSFPGSSAPEREIELVHAWDLASSPGHSQILFFSKAAK